MGELYDEKIREHKMFRLGIRLEETTSIIKNVINYTCLINK